MCLHDVVIAFHFLLSFLLGGWHMNLAFAPSLFARFLKLSPSPKINTRCEKHFLAPARNFKSQRRRKIETFFMFFIIKKSTIHVGRACVVVVVVAAWKHACLVGREG